MLQVNNLSKVFPARRREDPDIVALNGVSLEIKPSEFFCMIGPSGCGKSTLLRLIAGLGRPTCGDIVLDGQRVVKTGPKALIVWQEFALLDWRTVIENVEFGLEVNGIGKRERREIADRYIQLVGLSTFRNHYPTELSGGMKQRVGLARVLAMDPEILLMDEPFGALDAQTRMVMQDEVLRIWEQNRKTVVFVTHSLEEAIVLSDRIAVFTARPGRIKEVIEVDLPRPRPPDIRASAAFGQLYDRLYQLLREEVQKTVEMEYTMGGHSE